MPEMHQKRGLTIYSFFKNLLNLHCLSRLDLYKQKSKAVPHEQIKKRLVSIPA